LDLVQFRRAGRCVLWIVEGLCWRGIPRRSGLRTVVKSIYAVSCCESLDGQCSCLKKLKSYAKNRSNPLEKVSETIECEVLA